MSNEVKNLIDNVSKLSLKEQQKFIDYYESGLYNFEQMSQIYLFLKDNLDCSLIDSRLSPYLLRVVHDLLIDENSIYHLSNLLTYDEEIIQRVVSYYRNGQNIISLIELEDSVWYVEFLLRCLENNINLDSLKDKHLSYASIWNLANCIILRYDVDSFLELYKEDLPDVTMLDIVRYFIGEIDSPSRLFIVNTNDLVGEDEDSSYVVLARNEREAMLYSCLNGQFEAFNLEVKEIKIDGSSNGIVFYK